MVQFARVKDLLELPEHLSKSAFVLKLVSFIARRRDLAPSSTSSLAAAYNGSDCGQDREPPHALGDRISAAGY